MGSQEKGIALNEDLLNGPDNVAEAYSYIQTRKEEPVKLHTTDEAGKITSLKPISVPSFLKRTVDRIPNNIALAVKRNNVWKKWTYREYYEDIKTAAKALLHLGLEAYKGVGIIGFNSPEWFIGDLAAILAGGIAMGIYSTNKPKACEYAASHGECNIIFVENNDQLEKFLQIRQNLPDLKAIVQYTGNIQGQYENVYTWEQFMQFGREANNEDLLNSRLKGLSPNKCCTLVFTSGTTGDPKAVMLSHDNLTWTGQANVAAAKLKFGIEKMVSYLPLSHIAAQMMDIYTVLACGCSVYFAQPDALKGSLGVTLKEVRPTSFFGVPRVWEKMAEKMTEIGKTTKGLKKSIATWAKDIGKRGTENMANGNSLPFGWGLANALVFKKVRAALGLDMANICLSGAAAIRKETIEYFLQFNIIITEVYGMSECSGPQCVGFPWAYRVGSCGKEIEGMSTKLDKARVDQSDALDGQGEVCMLGRHVFMGYLNNEEKTRECLSEEGWLSSGDVGKKDDQGNLFITGRIKELIITAGGENIPPIPIEDAVKAALPCVSQCVLVGEKRRFLSMLITLKTDVDADTLVPKDDLAPLALDWCREKGSNVRKVSEILNGRDENVLKGIQSGIDQANSKATSRAQTIQKWSILPVDFSIPGGEFSNTLKVKRAVVHKMYKQTEEAFYA